MKKTNNLDGIMSELNQMAEIPFLRKAVDVCANCGAILGACDTIWAAGESLYCSRECGISDYSRIYDAEQMFDEQAEEVNPTDIGIDRR